MPVVQQTVIMPEESVSANDPYEHTLEIANEIELFPGMLTTRISYLDFCNLLKLGDLFTLYSSVQ